VISTSLIESIVNYLSTKPYREVYTLIQAVQQEIAQHQAAQQTEEKGEE
jgi:hypothetical protein